MRTKRKLKRIHEILISGVWVKEAASPVSSNTESQFCYLPCQFRISDPAASAFMSTSRPLDQQAASVLRFYPGYSVTAGQWAVTPGA